MTFSDLEHIKAELGLDVREGIVFVRNVRAIFFLQFRVQQRYNDIGGERMAFVVSGIMGDSAESESVFVESRGISQQGEDEIAAAKIVGEIAEELIAGGIVTHILDDRTAVGIGVGLNEFVRGSVGKTLQQERP